MLPQDAAFHKFNEMSTIGPWIDRQGMLQLDYVSGAGLKGARCVRNGNARKDALIESGGYMVNEHGVRCIKGYTTWAICAQKFTKPMHWVSIIHISAYLFYAKGVRQSNGRMVTL